MDASSKSSPRRKSKPKGEAGPPVAIVRQPRGFQQRVFLYMQLNDIINLPVVSYPLELHMYHPKNTLQKLSEHYTTDTIIYQDEFQLARPVFTMAIWQDDIEDMNMFSDNPLVISLYQRIPQHRRCDLKTVRDVRTDISTSTLSLTGKSTSVSSCSVEDEDYEEETLEFISRGHCDLLQLFQRKRFIRNISIMLYPEYERKLQTLTSQKITTTTKWHMYSIIPMLKNFNFCNLAFFTLESIYNAPEELHNRAGQLGIRVSIRSTRSDQNDRYKVIPLCTFYCFVSQIISAQNTIVVWENMKRDLLNNVFGTCNFSNNQMGTSARIKLPHLFRQLLTPADANLNTDSIDIFSDRALINNSLHRYVLTSEMRQILETAVHNNDYVLLLQLYDEIPGNVLYEGTINPSIFGYPNVNSCRFACPFYPVTRRSRKSLRLSYKLNADASMFAVLKLCFFQPLTKHNDSLDACNEDMQITCRLRRCADMGCLMDYIPSGDILKELYRTFDELIRELIGFIIKNEVKDVSEYRGAFCCHLGNLRNLLVDICGADFNAKTPTKTNIEFREMLTHMHKDLMDRIENLVTCCQYDSQTHCVVNFETEDMRTRRLLVEYRNMCLLGECVLAKQLYEEINAASNNKLLFHFYLFLNAVENLNFDLAANYVLSEKDGNWHGAYFVALLKVYIDYQRELRLENEAGEEGEAFSNMLEQLRKFAAQNNLDREVWILLYCYYKQKMYLPGMEFTRWKYENLYKIRERSIPPIPGSLYKCFMLAEFEPNPRTVYAAKFYAVFRTFAELGAYGFAQVVFDEIAGEFLKIEQYLINTTLNMLQGKIDDSFDFQNPPHEETEQEKLLSYYLFHIHGNVEYSLRRFDSAIAYFKHLLSLTTDDIEILPHFYISFLRLGHLCFEQKDYETALKAYALCAACNKGQRNFIANYSMGLALYYKGELKEALQYIALTTDNEVYMADPWGYLALINLRLQHNQIALECWKIAKKYPEIRLNQRIYEELDKVSYSHVCLLVDDACKPLSKDEPPQINYTTKNYN